ncbi:MAG: reverse transcriptase/maturase family protein [Eubacteriales bacterium]|nr:reverse transcriptase/maturase family protein [Eubacteriales bacterium]
MKKATELMRRITEYENLIEAEARSAEGKRGDAAILRYEDNLYENLQAIATEFLSGTYESKLFHEKYVHIPQTRLIQISPFKDRVAQQAIYGVLAPILEKQYIYDSYACRTGKGALKAANRVQYWLREIHRKQNGAHYVAGKIDAAKFFYRMDHQVILNVLGKYVDDDLFMKIVSNIINCRHTAFGLPDGRTCTDTPREERLFDAGVPIGSLMSQTMANMVMNELDQYAKHCLRIHYYIRYMDDIIILAPDIQTLQRWMDAIQRFMLEKLKLKCNSKTAVIPLSHGIPFVGKRIWATHMLLRKSTVKHLKRTLKHIAWEYAQGLTTYDEVMQRMASYKGLLEQADTYAVRKWIEENIVFHNKGQGGDDLSS